MPPGHIGWGSDRLGSLKVSGKGTLPEEMGHKTNQTGESMIGSKYSPLISTLEQALTEASLADYPELIGIGERFTAQVRIKIMSGMASVQVPHTSRSENGQYLTVPEVCKVFHVTSKWLYRHKKQLPHSQPSRKLLLFPEGKLRKWFSTRNKY